MELHTVYHIEYLQKEFFLISKQSNDRELFLSDSSNCLVCFETAEATQEYITRERICLVDTIPIYLNVNAVCKWVDSFENVCTPYDVLTLWNVMSSIAYSIDEKFEGDQKDVKTRQVYEKIFWGKIYLENEMLTSDEKAKERWPKEEKERVTEIYKDGLRFFYFPSISFISS